MKLNKIMMALAATAIVGCTSDDLNDFGSKQAVEDSRLIELNENFVLAGVGADGVVTRTHWDWEGTPGKSPLVNKFLPIWAAVPTTGNAIYDATTPNADLEAQAVGLCWLGQVPDEKVYTNYQFYHFGWLNVDETKAEFDCGTLTNGALYDEITLTPVGTINIGDEAKEAHFTGYTTASGKTGTPSTDLNFNSGVYKTDNKSIFKGNYIVYYPFNEAFKEAGTIPALAKTVFGDGTTTGVSRTFDTPEIGHATFRYSAPVTIEGGDQAADFGLYNLSTLVQLKVSAPTGDAAIGDDIDQIVLWSEQGQLLKQANLAADKIVAGKRGAELYASTEGTKTITANFITGAPLVLKAVDGTPESAYITVLPTTVEDLVVLVHNKTDKKWARVDMPDTEFKAGNAMVLNISVSDEDFTTDYIAVDEASLTTALGEARLVATAANPQTITVIGDITLKTAAYNINNAADVNITITGDDIIVPEDVLLRVNTNIESDIRVLGKSCCSGVNGGMLYVQGGTISNVTLEPTGVKKELTTAEYNKYNPYLYYTAAGTSPATVAAGKTIEVQAGRVNVQKSVQHKGDIKIAEGAKLTVTTGGDLNFMGSTVLNNGTIEVKKNGKYDMTDANGNAEATDGQRMTNNGTFIHNVDAGVGTAVQSMQQNGEYRCRVDNQIKLDDAFLQWTACSVIEMVEPTPSASVEYNLGTAAGIEYPEGTSTPYMHNGKYIDIEVNTTSQTKFVNNGHQSDNIMIRNLTVTAGGLEIDYVNPLSATVPGLRQLTVNGDMTVAANATITDSKKITVTGDLTVENSATLTFEGAKANIDGLAVTGDINVSGAKFDAGAGTTASDVDALGITCANFYLTDGATAVFGNRTDGAAKNLVVSGTISNPAGCTFNIKAANQVGSSVLAWVSCKKLEVGGTFSAARPRVVE